MTDRRMLSIIFSFRNEQAVLGELLERVGNVLNKEVLIKRLSDYELIFVNDSSTDKSLEILKASAEKDRRVRVISMSRRFGVYECVLAGLKYCCGDAVVYMDADLQDPPEVLPEIISKWFEGNDIVYTTRISREGENPIKKFITQVAYRALNRIADVPLNIDSGDYRLISRKVIPEILKLEEHESYFRGIIDWVGFRTARVFYKRGKRAAGRSQRGLLTGMPAKVFCSAVVGFSNWPVGFIGKIGAVCLVLASILLIGSLFFLPPGAKLANYLLMSAIFFMGGVQLMCLWMIGLYIGRIHHNVRQRPNYIVESTIGFQSDALVNAPSDSRKSQPKV